MTATAGRAEGGARGDRAADGAPFVGPGEMRARCRAFDWTTTPLGPPERWTHSLRTAADIALASAFPTVLLWGPALVMLHNDAYAALVGAEHPGALGRPLREVLPKIWEASAPHHARVWQGETVTVVDAPRLLRRRGPGAPAEEGYFTLAFSPVRDDAGAVGGILLTVFETTREVLTRRLQAERAQLLGERERARADAAAAGASLAAERGALASSEARFRAVQDASPVGFGIHRPVRAGGRPDGAVVDFELAYINTAGARMLGAPPEEMVGRTLLELFPATRDLGVFAAYRRVLETGEPHEQELAYRHGGLDVGLALSVVRVGDDVAVSFADVTHRLRADAERARLVAELTAERERLQAVILHMPAPVALLVGPEHRFELVNAAYRRVSGGGRDVTGLTPPEAFPELAGSGVFELFERVYATGEPWSGPETRLHYDRDGRGVQETWFDLHFEPLRDADGRVTAILNFAVDVTEQVRSRHEVERLLLESERARAEAEAARARSDAVLGSIADAFYLLDRDWRFTYVNDAAEPLLQTTREALLGRTLWEAFPGVAGSPFEGPYREALATGRATSAEAYFEPLGTWFDVHTYTWAGGLMVHFRDIGARKAAEAERERLLAETESARREAEAANRAKSEFLATMSHELRTPLNAIGGYAELMEMGIRGPVSPVQVEDLRRIQASQRHLLGLVNEVLNYARIETGTVRYDVADVPLAAVVASVEPLVAPQLAAKGLAFSYDGARDASLVARADGEKVRQVLLNLLSNAVKFTDAPGRVAVTFEGAGEHVLVRVADTGIGIAPEELERVFEPFVQVNASLTRTHEGTGLGLAISRDLARGMGGDLAADSAPGRGSVFTLTLPRAS